MLKRAEARRVRAIRSEALTPGTSFEYRVWARTGPNGDFEEHEFNHRFRRSAGWLIFATVMEQAEEGSRTMFNVLQKASGPQDSLMTVDGIILPRVTGPDLSPARYGKHSIQEGFATDLGSVLINGEPAENRGLIIPIRNINIGSLRLFGPK